VATTVLFISSIFTPWAVVWASIPVGIALTAWFWPKPGESRARGAAGEVAVSRRLTTDATTTAIEQREPRAALWVRRDGSAARRRRSSELRLQPSQHNVVGYGGHDGHRGQRCSRWPSSCTSTCACIPGPGPCPPRRPSALGHAQHADPAGSLVPNQWTKRAARVSRPAQGAHRTVVCLLFSLAFLGSARARVRHAEHAAGTRTPTAPIVWMLSACTPRTCSPTSGTAPS
jgi:hypothetical protein